MSLSVVAVGSDARRVIRLNKLVLLLVISCLMFHMLEASSRGRFQDLGHPSLIPAQKIRFSETVHSPDKLLGADSGDVNLTDSEEFYGPVDGDHEHVQSPSERSSTRKDEVCTNFCFVNKAAGFVFQMLQSRRPPAEGPPSDPTPPGEVGL